MSTSRQPQVIPTRRGLSTDSLRTDLRPALAHPPLAGRLQSGVFLPGLRGVVADYSGSALSLWRTDDAQNFTSGTKTPSAAAPTLQVVAATTDGRTPGTVRAGVVTLTAVTVSRGLLVCSGNWNSLIAGLAIGDFLFAPSEFGPAVVSSTSVTPPNYSSGSVLRMRHGLRGKPSGFQVLGVTGSQDPALRLLYADSEWIHLESLRATTVDLNIF